MAFGNAPVPGSGTPLTPRSARLRLLSPAEGESFTLPGLRTLVGRKVPMSEVDLDLSPLDTETPRRISRIHAEFLWAEGTLQIRDLGSTNGTWVNGERLQGPEPRQPSPYRNLQAEDRIRLGHLEFELTADPSGGN
jgi:pSer/pThr/pTyr-binding forkhead associated (FHA) protein